MEHILKILGILQPSKLIYARIISQKQKIQNFLPQKCSLVRNDAKLKNNFYRKTMKNYIDELKKWFDEKIKIHQKTIETKYHYKKGDIWYVDFGVNIGNEFNKIRPAVILTNKKYSTGNNIVVIPVTTFTEQKSILQTDIIITVNHKSVLKINHIRDISKKRLLKKIGRISDEELKELDTKIKDFFDIRT